MKISLSTSHWLGKIKPWLTAADMNGRGWTKQRRSVNTAQWRPLDSRLSTMLIHCGTRRRQIAMVHRDPPAPVKETRLSERQQGVLTSCIVSQPVDGRLRRRWATRRVAWPEWDRFHRRGNGRATVVTPTTSKQMDVEQQRDDCVRDEMCIAAY